MDQLLDRPIRNARDQVQVLHGEIHYFDFPYECEGMILFIVEKLISFLAFFVRPLIAFACYLEERKAKWK